MNKLEEIKAYREHKGLNYSLLKNVIENNTKPFKGNIHSDMGSALDARITLSLEEFDELYVVYDEDRYTGKLSEIMLKTFQKYSYYNPITKDFHYYLDKLVLAAQEAEYGGKNKKPEKIIEDLEKIKDYWNLLILKQTREIISKSELEYIDKVVYKLKNELPGKIIFENNPQYQVPIYGQVKVRGEMVDVKGLIDILLISDEGITLIDLKRTSYNLDNFLDVVYKSKYFIQMSLYKDILQQYYPDKKITCFWLAVNAYDIRVFETHESDLRFGRSGCKKLGGMVYDHTDEKIIKEETILGYEDAIAIFLDSKALGLSDYNVEKYYNKGVYPPKSIFE